jgi:hypothetical protein
MSAVTARRFTLVGLATVSLLFFAGMLLGGRDGSGLHCVAVIGPAGSAVMGVLATGCAAAAARAVHGGQRRAWIALVIGLGSWTAGAGVWRYVALGGVAPVSNSSVAELGYVVVPLCALADGVLLPSRDDSRFGIALLLDGVIVAASLFLAVGSLVLGRADTLSFPRILLAVVDFTDRSGVNMAMSWSDT